MPTTGFDNGMYTLDLPADVMHAACTYVHKVKCAKTSLY